MKKSLFIVSLLTAGVASAQVAAQHEAQECKETATVVAASKINVKEGTLASPAFTSNNTVWYSGYAKSAYSLTSAMLHAPAYADLQFNILDPAEGVSYSWNYVDPSKEYSMFNPRLNKKGTSLEVNYAYEIPTTIEAPKVTATNAVGDSVSQIPVYMRVGGPSTDNANTGTKYGWNYVSPKAGSLYYSSTYFNTNNTTANANWTKSLKLEGTSVNTRGFGEVYPKGNSPYALRGVQTHIREIALITSPVKCTIYKVKLNENDVLTEVLDTLATQTINPADFQAAGTSRYFLCFDKLVDYKTGKVVEGYTIKDDILVTITLANDKDVTSCMGLYYNGVVDNYKSHVVVVFAEETGSTLASAYKNLYQTSLNWTSGTKTRSLNIGLLGSYEYVLGTENEFEATVDGGVKTFELKSSVPYADSFGFSKNWTATQADGSALPEWVSVAAVDTYESDIYMGTTKVTVTATPNTGYARECDVVLSFLGADYTIHVAQAAMITSINDVEVEVVDENAPVYNMQGQLVGRDAKGLLIKNGKKVLVK